LSELDHPILTSLDYATIFFTEQGCWPYIMETYSMIIRNLVSNKHVENHKKIMHHLQNAKYIYYIKLPEKLIENVLNCDMRDDRNK
jgi:hypothetical protein